jgi:crotonobetainyl-CoA:carnitine CoA-transferase CaiB-like acyl-CoA transferase
VEEAMGDPQVAHRQAFGEVRDAAGTFRVLNPPFRFSAAPATVQPFAAALGEHGDEVLKEAGYSGDEIAELRKRRVLG